MELKNNYKVIYEVFDSAKQERTFYASKNTALDPKVDLLIAGPIKIGTYKVVYQDGLKIVGIKEYGEAPVEVADLTEIADEDKPVDPSDEKAIEEKIAKVLNTHSDRTKGGVTFNPFLNLKSLRYYKQDGKINLVDEVFGHTKGDGKDDFAMALRANDKSKESLVPEITMVDDQTKVAKLEWYSDKECTKLIYKEGEAKTFVAPTIIDLISKLKPEENTLSIFVKLPYEIKENNVDRVYYHEFKIELKEEDAPIPGVNTRVSTEAELIEALNGEEEKIQLTSNITLGNGKDPVTYAEPLKDTKKILYTGTNTVSVAENANINDISVAGAIYFPKNYKVSIDNGPEAAPEIRVFVRDLNAKLHLDTVTYVDPDYAADSAEISCVLLATKVGTLEQLKAAIANTERGVMRMGEQIELTADINLNGETIVLPELPVIGKQKIVMNGFKFTNGTVDGKQYK